MLLFKLLGVLLLAYIGWSVWRGEVHAKSGLRWASVSRDESPKSFWAVLTCYALLGVALLTVF